MREWETATWATGQTEAEVIRQVGKRMARLAHQLTRAQDAILILAGQGHNGDDARAAKDFLADRKVKILDLLPPEPALPPVELALREKPALIIDGLFGIGLNRPLTEPWCKIIAAVNAADIPVLAVDVPSGLDADTGDSFGATIEADVTLTIGAPKTGLLAMAAWPLVGRLEMAEDVGLTGMALKLGPYFLWFIFPIPIGVRDIFEFVTRLVQVGKRFWPSFHGARLTAARSFGD